MKNNLLALAFKSLMNRKTSTVLTVLSMALSLILLMSVERIKRAAEDGFTQTVSGVDLIVGARSSPLQVVLYSVFNIGQATQNLSIESYNEIKNKTEVEWTIPYSLGDGHKGFRVVATNLDFFNHYQYRSKQKIQFADGQAFSNLFDVVVGADVARTLNYKLADSVVIAHGTTTGLAIQEHDDKPFKVVGILRPTGTAVDRAIYISLQAMEAIHIDWQSGSAPALGKEIKVTDLKDEMLQPKAITSFFLRTKNRIETLRLQREINEYQEEALTAAIPGAVLAEMWQSLSMVEKVLKAISFLVMLVGLMAMLIALMTSLNERRREMAILRVLGASLKTILFLIMAETFLLTMLSIFLAVVVKFALEIFLGPWLQIKYGLYLVGSIFTSAEWFYMLFMLISALIISFIPGYRAMKSALKDGLSVKL